MPLSDAMKRLVRSLLKGRRLPVVLGLVLTLLVASLQVLPPDGIGSLIDRLDNLIYDQRYNLMSKPSVNPEHKIVVVDIDERSLQAEGQWPWDRFKLGQLLERLTEYGVLVTGFDITFPEPQRNTVRDIAARSDELTLDTAFVEQLRTLEQELDADRYFAQAIANPMMSVVLAVSFNPV
jgi:adenylate cyclase